MLKVGDVVYIVRYALTRGVIKLKLRKINFATLPPDQIWFGGYIFGLGKNVDRRYYTSEADALRCVEEMREAKTERLLNQIKKLQAKKLKVIDAERF